MQIHATLRHYAHTIRQHIVFILLGIVFCVSTTGLISLCIPPTYQARALLKVNNPAATSSNDVSNAQAQAVDYALLVTSPEVLRVVAQKLPGVTVGKLQQAISDSPIENTQIIEIRAQAEEGQLAADIANTVAVVFIQLQATKEADRLQTSATMLTQRIAATRLDLDAAQQYLSVLQNNHAAPASIAQQKSLVDTDQANYGLLLTNYSQLQVQKLQAATLLSVAQTAQTPDRPSSPQPFTNMLLATAMSLLVMILLVLLLDWLDTTLKTSEDVINMTGLLPLGCIPAGSRIEGTELLDLAATGSSPVREALGTLGIRLRAQLKGQRFLLVSGVRTKAGVTTVAVHLAVSLAQSGMRVLLLDTNRHRPLLHEIFRISNMNGLSNRLTDLERFREQPTLYPNSWLHHWKTPIANVWLIPTGPPPVPAIIMPVDTETATPAPTRVPINIQELQQLKEWLLGERQIPDESHLLPLIDLIICDTAPLDEDGDTYGLSTIADGVVMVIEAGKEQKETLCDIHALHLQAPILGVVVNRQKAGQTSYYYTHPQSKEHPAAASLVSISKEDQALREQKPFLHDIPAHEQQTVSEVPGVRFAAPGFKLRKVTVQATPPPPFSLHKGRKDITTDPLPEANQGGTPELQAARMVSESKTQFKIRPGKGT